jgi:5-methylcytosine-specific restriction endonuclease McrA
MPIKKENVKLYPLNWKKISSYIRLERANGKCEVCGAVNYSHVNKYTREICLPDEYNSIMIVLTTAHLDHNPTNCDYSNLKAMCQRCHNRYDISHRKQTRQATKNKNNFKLAL